MLKLIHFQASLKHSALIPAADKEASQRISIHLHNAIKSVDSFAFSVVMGFSMSSQYFWDGNFESSPTPTWTINENILMNMGALRVCVCLRALYMLTHFALTTHSVYVRIKF